MSTAWICETCGVEQAPTGDPPETCVICIDERQYVGWEGQRWTHREALARTHTTVLREEEPGLIGVGVEPPVAIGQRALLVRTAAGNVLWDCVPLVDDDAVAALADLGGVTAICMSHPHFYGACVTVAEALDAWILLPRADERWIQYPSRRVELFEDETEPVPGLRVRRIGGHFDGAAVLHWPGGADGRGALLTGDTIQVVQDREWVSFMWSYPNLIPLDADTVAGIAEAVQDLPFERIYGGWWGRVVVADGPAVVRRSAERYRARLAGKRPAH